MNDRGQDPLDSLMGTDRHRDSRGTRLGLGGGYGGQWLGLADAEFALFQRGLKVRSNMADQRNMAGRHHQGQQHEAKAGACHHGTILKQFPGDAPKMVAFWHPNLPELRHIKATRLAIMQGLNAQPLAVE